MKLQLGRTFFAAIAALLLMVPYASAAQMDLFTEDFDILLPFLGPAVDEGIDPNIIGWTSNPPDDWSIDNSGVPGIGNPNEGMTEWEGWAFVTPEFWTAADGQQRGDFTLGTGVIAVADPDEWDDLGDPEALGTYNTFLKTPNIDLPALATPGSAALTFSSSWRPEDFQAANITVSYDGGAKTEVLRWESQAGPNFKPDATNETVTVALNNPAGATSMVVEFGMIEAGNDWWWAIDNVNVSTDVIPEPSSIALALLALLGGAAYRMRMILG